MIKADYPNRFTELDQVNSYLHQLAEKINLNFANTTAEAIWRDTEKALSVLGDKEASAKEKTDILASYSAMRSLIIKTAEYTVENSEKIKLSMAGEYVAKSEFGDYFEKATVDIEGTPVGITQLYGYTSGITGEFGDITVDSHNFIKTGLLYYDENSLPVYGVGVGELATKVDANGHTVLDRSNLLATYTADEIAFWQNAEKVAYINNGALYMPAANITGGTLNINNKFTVDLLGNMKAENADITGKVKCTVLDCTNATVKGLVVGDNITMGDNATISWGKINNKPNNLATTDDIPTDSAITAITQNAIQTGDLHLGGSVYHMTGTYWWNSDEHLLLGINQYDNLQVGTPSTTADYKNANIYAPQNIYLLPGRGTLSKVTESGTNWTMVVRGPNSESGQGVSVHGNLSATGNIYVDGQSVCLNGHQHSGSDISGGYPSVKSIYLTEPGTAEIVAIYRSATSGILGVPKSSRRYKNSIENVNYYELKPERLYDLPVRQFKWNEGHFEDEEHYNYDLINIGFIAEEVAEVYPFAAVVMDGQIETWEARGLIPPMLALIQDHKKEIDALKERIYILEN